MRRTLRLTVALGALSLSGSSSASPATQAVPPGAIGWERLSPVVRAPVNGSWVDTDATVWAVGDAGLVLRKKRDEGWETIDLRDPADFSGVWGTGAEDVWIAAGAKVLHYLNGKTTEFPIAKRKLYRPALWGFSAADIWLAASSGYGPGAVLHWDGTQWGEVRIPGAEHESFQAVWGSRADDVWVAGYQACFHWDGGRWTRFDGGAYAIWGRAANDVWLGGGKGVVHWDGARLTPMPLPEPWVLVTGLWATDSGNLWALGSAGEILRWDGTGWARLREASTLGSMETIAAAASDDIWFFGKEAVHWNGHLSDEGAGIEKPSVLFANDDSVWVIDRFATDSLRRLDGTRWVPAGAGLGVVESIAMRRDGELWVASPARGLARSDGSSWTWEAIPDFEPRAVAVDANDAVWAAGTGTSRRFCRKRLFAISCGVERGPGKILRQEGDSWTVVYELPERSFEGLAFQRSTAWALEAQEGEALRFDGSSSWQKTAPRGIAIDRIWISEAGKAWAIGRKTGRRASDCEGVTSVVLSWVSGRWEPVHSVACSWLTAISGVGETPWIVGSHGLVLHFDGQAWASETVGEELTLRALAATASGNVVVVADGGALLRRKASP